MKTFNLNKPYEELSFNEVLSILIIVADDIKIVKTEKDNEIYYHVTATRDIKSLYDNDMYDAEFELNSLHFLWDITTENENVDYLEKQNSKTRNQLDSYFESAINLGLIKLK